MPLPDEAPTQDAAALVVPVEAAPAADAAARPGPSVPLTEVHTLPFPLVHAELPNGLDVWVQPRPGSTSVTGYLVFRAGGRYETDANSGASHLLEHMVFVETERWKEDEVRAFIDQMGGRYNGYTGNEQVGYWTQMPAGRTGDVLDWLGQIAFHPKLPADKLDKEREVVFEERNGRDGWTRRTLKKLGIGRNYREEIRKVLFPGSSRSRPVIGEDGSLDSITIDDLRAFYTRHYHAGNAGLVVVGPDDPAEVVAQVEARFGALPSGQPSHPPQDAGPSAPWPRNTVRSLGILDRCTVTLAARGPGRADADLWASNVLLEYLRTELYDSLRGERGLTYGVSAWNNELSDIGELAIESDTDCANVDTMATAFEAAVDRVRAGTVDAARLERAKTALVGRWALDVEDGRSRALWLASYLTLDDPYANAAKHEAIPRVTAAEVTAVAGRWLAPEARGVWVLRPVLTITQAWVAGVAAAVVVGGVLFAWARHMRRRAG